MRTTQIFAPPQLPYRDYTLEGVTFRMITLPGLDNFAMGSDEGEEGNLSSEEPKHSRVIKPFALAEYPVTQALWTAVNTRARAQKLKFDPELLPQNPAYFSGPERPVENVSWDYAQEFCRVLNLLLDKPKRHFRLPSEAEWEYAARAGERETLYAGSNLLDEVGWHAGNNEEETMSVSLLTPNAFGLYDLSGNVWEWSEPDRYDIYENTPSDRLAWMGTQAKEDFAMHRVRRGSSWSSGATFCRLVVRIITRPDFREPDFGFRLAAPPHPRPDGRI